MQNIHTIYTHYTKVQSVYIICRAKLIKEQAVVGRPPRYASPCKLTMSSYLFARRHLFWHVDYLSWPLTYWPRRWCPSHVWRGLPLCQFQSSKAVFSS